MPSAAKALCDSGPLVALFDPRDTAHEVCLSCLQAFRGSLVTSWAVLTEAFHFLDQPREREYLWEFISRDALHLEDIHPTDFLRLRSLMAKYADLPMDFADASLVVLAERLRLRKVFTLDRHFRFYRPRHGAFEIIP